MELPLRPPGAPTWPKVAKHGRKVRREELIRQREIKARSLATSSVLAPSSKARSP